MANTITSTIVYGGAKTLEKHILYRCISDGTALTAGLMFTNASQGTGTVTGGRLMGLEYSGKTTGTLRIEWKQTTNSPICSIGPNEALVSLDYRDIGGIPNPGATGATGDIVITDTGIATGDEFTILLKIRQQS